MRVKAKAKRLVRKILRNKRLDEWANKNAEHLKSCSCYMCGNPRKYFKKRTIQEKRLMQIKE